VKTLRQSTGEDRIAELMRRHRDGQALARPFYVDPALFERDWERVIGRHWHCLTHVSVVPAPGDFELFRIGAEQIILTRGADGQLHALLNVCRHRGAEVCTKTRGNARQFVCPYHAWTYSNDGALRGARLMPAGFDRSAHGLKKLALREVAGLVFISFAKVPLDFEPAAALLESSCGTYGWQDAKVAHREWYEIEANWKLAVENYVECYHCAPAHPEYAKTHALERAPEAIQAQNLAMEQRTRQLGIEISAGDQWKSSGSGREAIHVFRYALYDGVATGSEGGKPVAPLMGRFTGYDGGVTSIHVGGTSFLVCYPDYGMIYRFIPKTTDTCAVELLWLVRGDAVEGRDYSLDRLAWLWRVTTEQDKKIIEHTARGVRSRFYEPGPISPMEYNELRYIRWYLEEIRGS